MDYLLKKWKIVFSFIWFSEQIVKYARLYDAQFTQENAKAQRD